MARQRGDEGAPLINGRSAFLMTAMMGMINREIGDAADKIVFNWMVLVERKNVDL